MERDVKAQITSCVNQELVAHFYRKEAAGAAGICRYFRVIDPLPASQNAEDNLRVAPPRPFTVYRLELDDFALKNHIAEGVKLFYRNGGT